VRDLTEDLGSGEEGLLYFSREDMDAFGLTELRLRADVEARRASAQTRDLIAALLGRARTHLSLGRDSLTGVESDLDPDCRFILDLIITIYERVVDKIESCDFDPMADRHRLSRTEKTQIVRAVAGRTGFVLHQGPF
jgi:phytoene/squalene synthetase